MSTEQPTRRPPAWSRQLLELLPGSLEVCLLAPRVFLLRGVLRQSRGDTQRTVYEDHEQNQLFDHLHSVGRAWERPECASCEAASSRHPFMRGIGANHI